MNTVEDSLNVRFSEHLRYSECTVAGIENFLAQGADPNTPLIGDFGSEYSPLMLAAMQTNPEFLKVLLEAGANPNDVDADGYTAMLYASNVEQVQVLVQYGATYPRPTKYFETPLNSAYRDCNLSLVRYLLEIGGPRGEMQAGALHFSIVYGGQLSIEEIIERYDALEAIDYYERTPLLLALQAGHVQSARALIEMGASLEPRDCEGLTALHLAAGAGVIEAVKLVHENGGDLRILDLRKHSAISTALQSEHASKSFGTGESIVEYLFEQVSDNDVPYALLDDALGSCESPQIARWLLRHGANFNSMRPELREKLNPSAHVDYRLAQITKDQFLLARKPRSGTSNPEKCNESYWQAMIVERAVAYAANKQFEKDTDEKDWIQRSDGPTWCADRFGQSITWLDDGRCIEIGGEHEDFYDSNFCIYNDVIVHEPGKLPQIFLYPREVFPPTDFHSATLVGDWIYLIGSIGYREDRTLNVCPVYRLNIDNLHIEQVATTGKDPGRICRHRAILRGERYIEVSDGKLCANGIAYGTPSPPVTFDTACHVWLDIEGLESTNQEI